MENEDKILLTTSMGDTVIRRDESIIIAFQGKRNVVSTSNLNGGYREDLQFVYNNSCGKNPMIQQQKCPGMKGKTLCEHYEVIARECKLPPEKTTGMGTAALMENVAIVAQSFEKLQVTAIVTGGIDVNGGSAGDLARYNEFAKKPINIPPGTINIFLLIDAKLPAGVLTRAMVTATEAKSVALRELAAPSLYSEEPATGSGTDSTIVVGNLESEVVLHGAGKHCILGQLIGQTVIQAVKKALDKQSGMNTKRQASILWQGKRYGITEERLYELYKDSCSEEMIPFDNFQVRLYKVATDNKCVGFSVSLLHLIDQYRWGIIKLDTLRNTAISILNCMRREESLNPIVLSNNTPVHYKEFIDYILKTVVEIIIKNI